MPREGASGRGEEEKEAKGDLAGLSPSLLCLLAQLCTKEIKKYPGCKQRYFVARKQQQKITPYPEREREREKKIFFGETGVQGVIAATNKYQLFFQELPRWLFFCCCFFWGKSDRGKLFGTTNGEMTTSEVLFGGPFSNCQNSRKGHKTFSGYAPLRTCSDYWT